MAARVAPELLLQVSAAARLGKATRVEAAVWVDAVAEAAWVDAAVWAAAKAAAPGGNKQWRRRMRWGS